MESSSQATLKKKFYAGSSLPILDSSLISISLFMRVVNYHDKTLSFYASMTTRPTG
jgi:hypothetical protein